MLHATRNMASVFKHFSYLSRLLLVISRIGNAFLFLREFTAVVERFVFGYNVHQVIERSSTFAAETESVAKYSIVLEVIYHSECGSSGSYFCCRVVDMYIPTKSL